MRIFITGATGFVGTEIVKLLLKNGHQVSALVRDPERLTVSDNGLLPVVGDVLQPETYRSALEDIDVVIHLVGIIREYPSKQVTFERMHTDATVKMVDAAKNAGVKRFIHMSANGARANAETDYHRTKFLAEEAVRNSGMGFVILQPSVIYGPRDIFINMLAGFMKLTPIFSYFGKGDQLMQPVSVFEVADIFSKAVDHPEIDGNAYTVCGNRVYTYKELLQMIMRVKKMSRLLMPVPEGLVSMGISVFGKQDWFPLTRDQFVMLLEGNTCDNKQIFELLNVNQMDMETVLKGYLNEL